MRKRKEAAWEAAGLTFILMTLGIIVWGVIDLTLQNANPVFLLILAPTFGASVAYGVTRFLLRERK